VCVVEGGCAELQTDFRIRQFSDLKKVTKDIRPADWKACERCCALANDNEQDDDVKCPG